MSCNIRCLKMQDRMVSRTRERWLYILIALLVVFLILTAIGFGLWPVWRKMAQKNSSNSPDSHGETDDHGIMLGIFTPGLQGLRLRTTPRRTTRTTTGLTRRTTPRTTTRNPPPGCGLRAVLSSMTGPYIVNGQQALRGAWPWQVAILWANSFYCGGTLINDRWILTAGHCVSDRQNNILSASSIKVIAGSIHRELYDPDSKTLYVDRVIRHPSYSPFDFTRDVITRDVALLRLSLPITFTETIRPICVTQSDVDLKEFKVCVATGYGQTSFSSSPTIFLMQGRMMPLSTDESYEAYNKINSRNWSATREDFNHFLCAGNNPPQGGIDICYGDGGGPLACQDQHGVWTEVGVTSFALGWCQLSCFARVSQYSSWVSDQMARNP